MDVYVLRHGVADERDYRKYPDDDLRPLIPEGIDKLTRQAKGLKAAGFVAGPGDLKPPGQGSANSRSDYDGSRNCQ